MIKQPLGIVANVPTNWDEVSFAQFIQAGVTTSPLSHKVSVLCKLPVEVTKLIPDAWLSEFETILSFLDDKRALDLLPLPSFEVAQYSLERYAKAVKLIDEAESKWAVADQIYAIFHYPEEFGEFDMSKAEAYARESHSLPISEVYPYCSAYFNGLEQFALAYNELHSQEPTQEQQIRSDFIGDMWVYPLVDNLAGGDVLKWTAVMKEPVGKIYNKLLYDHRMSKADKFIASIPKPEK